MNTVCSRSLFRSREKLSFGSCFNFIFAHFSFHLPPTCSCSSIYFDFDISCPSIFAECLIMSVVTYYIINLLINI